MISCDGCKYAGEKAFFHGESWTKCRLLDIGVEFYDHQFRKNKLKGCVRHKEAERDQNGNKGG